MTVRVYRCKGTRRESYSNSAFYAKKKTNTPAGRLGDFVETNICLLCVMLRSRVLSGCVSSLRIYLKVGDSSFFFFAHFHFPASGQAVVTGVIPSPPRFLRSTFIAHRVQQSHCSSIVHRVLLTHALALSASQFVHKEKSQRIWSSMHSAGLELTKLTYRKTLYATGAHLRTSLYQSQQGDINQSVHGNYPEPVLEGDKI